jgi:hypothetical protein
VGKSTRSASAAHQHSARRRCSCGRRAKGMTPPGALASGGSCMQFAKYPADHAAEVVIARERQITARATGAGPCSCGGKTAWRTTRCYHARRRAGSSTREMAASVDINGAFRYRGSGCVCVCAGLRVCVAAHARVRAHPSSM